MSLPTHFPIKVADGKTMQIPKGEDGWCKAAVLEALKAGYRHLDCAWMYGVNREIGEAIKESGIPRAEIFITTKFWPHFAAPENVEICMDICLREMDLEYIDLWLAHWPFALKPISREALKNAYGGPKSQGDEDGILEMNDKVVIDWEHTSSNIAKICGKEGTFLPTWKAMQALVRNGKTRAIGLSNFSIQELTDILPHAKDIPISCNQIEVHPWLPQKELIAFGKQHDILTTCYSPFAGQKADGATLLKEKAVMELARKNDMDVGQLLQSWAVQRGTVPLGKSSTPARIRSNLAVRRLSEKDMGELGAMGIPGGKGRTVDFTEAWGVPLYQN